MPEAELKGEDAYRFEIEERKELLADVVSESKPLVDFLALIMSDINACESKRAA